MARGKLTVALAFACACGGGSNRDAREVTAYVSADRPFSEPIMKEYERLTVRAVLARSVDAACEALANNPLVPDRATADRLVRDLSPLW